MARSRLTKIPGGVKMLLFGGMLGAEAALRHAVSVLNTIGPRLVLGWADTTRRA